MGRESVEREQRGREREGPESKAPERVISTVTQSIVRGEDS